MRARDIREVIGRRGSERGVVECLEKLAETQTVHEQRLAEIGAHLVGMADILGKLTTVGERMKETIQAMGTKYEEPEDIVPREN